MIKFGVMIMPQHPMSDPPLKRFHETVTLTRLARDVGLDSISCGQHFLSPPYQHLQSMPLLARLAADSGRMRLILSVVLLPLYSPVQVAEDVATLDVISDGRTVLGVGLGYRDIEYEGFNTTRGDRVARFVEALDLIRALWSEEEVTFEGTHFRVRNGVCTVRPIQRPHPPIWVAANNDGAIRRGGRLGYPWLINPHATLTTLERQLEVYRQSVSGAGKSMPDEIPLIREMHVASTREEAIRVAQPYLEGKYQAYADWGQDTALPGQESFRVPFEDLARDRFMLGDVEQVVEQIEEYHRRLGANHFIFRIWWPGMEAYHAYRVVELLGEHVIPHFRKQYRGTEAATV